MQGGEDDGPESPVNANFEGLGINSQGAVNALIQPIRILCITPLLVAELIAKIGLLPAAPTAVLLPPDRGPPGPQGYLGRSFPPGRPSACGGDPSPGPGS